MAEMAGRGTRLPLHDAILAGASSAKFAALLVACRDSDINCVDHNGDCPLRLAVCRDREDLVRLLLKHPAVLVNVANVIGHTAAHLAVSAGRLPILRTLVQDARVDFTCRSDGGRSVLRYASFLASVPEIRFVLASGRDVGPIPGPRDHAKDHSVFTQGGVCQGIIDLLAEFSADPVVTQHRLRVADDLVREWPTAAAADLFALIILLCDRYLRIPATTDLHRHHSPIPRFFTISNRLPLELQMVLALRARRLAQDIISTQDSEPAFRHLSRLDFMPSGLSE